MSGIIQSLNSAFTLAFVVTSMFGLGLGMTVQDLLAPLRNVRLVVAMIGINFIFIPSLASLLTRLLPLEPDLQIGLIIMSTVAGAPLAIKASQLARGNVAVAGSLVALQVIFTVAYLPFVLPRLIPGIAVDTVAISLPLSLQVLLPLAAGIVMNIRYDEEAEMARPIMADISNISLAIMLVLNLGNVRQVLGLVGTGAIAGILILIVAGLTAGYLLGGPDTGTRKTLALGSAQRNYAAAFVIAQGNFADQPDVFLMLLTASLISMIVILVVAGEFGRRVRGGGSNPARPAAAVREPVKSAQQGKR
ncbi:bile acid:sodium symporter [Chelativorans sp. Marseille-P2723]|uniref:bile acid:sodium symporter family protein n=1 Tax=Chelativorans sp. Marseille-P2723 TaxID=2709133 RepID=UPI00156D59F5|nr:bile acid:sodium symporter [Chelativorans sp. Marseille-P2723]